jgi:Fe-S-cluster-containing dehydrogenase component
MKRRGFLAAILGVAGSLTGIKLEVRALTYNWSEHSYFFVVDVTECIGCGRCVVACKVENDVPEHFFRTWVERYIWYEGEIKVDSPEGGFYGFPEIDDEDVMKSYFVPKLCNQCENPPCVQVCPVGATYRTPDGVVLVDEEYCIGCRYCIQACPYGARYLYPLNGKVESRRNTADKCTFCYHRITKNSKPACVEVCPTRARRIFDMGDEKQKEELFKIIENSSIRVLKPEQGTKPRVFYIGIDSEVR